MAGQSQEDHPGEQSKLKFNPVLQEKEKLKRKEDVLPLRCIFMGMLTVASIISIVPSVINLSRVTRQGEEHFNTMVVPLKPPVKPQAYKLIHVVESDDGRTVQGLLASLRSAAVNCLQPHKLRFYILTLRHRHNIVDESVDCLMKTTYHPLTNRTLEETIYGFLVLDFDIYEFNPKWQIAYREDDSLPDMSSTLNFARMYLHRFLRDKRRIPEPRPEQVISLDSDTIVLGDVAELYYRVFQGREKSKAVALAWRRLPLQRYKINFSHPILRDWQRRYFRQSKYIDPRSPAYNNGVSVQHLIRWDHQNLTENIEFWLQANLKEKLYSYGYNPPMLLGVMGSVERLPSSWNVDGLGYKPIPKEILRRANVLHWTGASKPWNARMNESYRSIWESYNTPSCIPVGFLESLEPSNHTLANSTWGANETQFKPT
eukprot:gb/GECG01016552.1/.p1 GENE.gb/GECG01016552.1/~~gb/GECG01016552.1/.p1  ORF type:complete len:429 (+),score=41.06 gb/GECG01016552.1/:1-1287(+)